MYHSFHGPGIPCRVSAQTTCHLDQKLCEKNQPERNESFLEVVWWIYIGSIQLLSLTGSVYAYIHIGII